MDYLTVVEVYEILKKIEINCISTVQQSIARKSSFSSKVVSASVSGSVCET